MSEAAENLGKSISLPSNALIDIVGMIDTFDRPRHAFAAGAFAGADAFAEGFKNKPGKRIPKAGAYAAAGVGYARAEWSVLDAEARGPNAAVGAGATLMGVQAMAKAELAGASASAGVVKATVGLAATTGVSACVDGVEIKLLGTGFKIGKLQDVKMSDNNSEVKSTDNSISHVSSTGINGPSASADGGMIRAELASTTVTAGPTTVKVGLAADTGVGVGKDGVEAKFLGTGFSIGRKTEISLFGTSFGFKLCEHQDLKMSSEAVKCVGDEISGKDLAGPTVAEIMERPSHAFATGAYAGTHEDDSSLYVGAGLGYARAEWKAFDAEARGPTFGAGLCASNSAVKAMAKAELASASASLGPTTVKVGLAADTGVGVGKDGVEAKVLGTGFTIGRKIEVSLFGSSIGFKLW
ncbi:uncharacterized protein V6R79_007489 [Siganus canaliculatus]